MSLIDSFGLYDRNLNGPVPIGCCRMLWGDIWHGYTGEYPEASNAIKAGCGRFKWNVTVSALVLTDSRLPYHALRGFARSFSDPFPSIRSHVHLTSAAVNGLPSCQRTLRLR